MERTPNCLAKLDRVNKTLHHEESDRVPISDFFWGSFIERWRQDLGLPADTDVYKYYDLDWIVMSVMMLIPAVIFVALVQRQLMEGLTSGAMKG